VKKALSFNDRFDKLFTPDYSIAHQCLVACADSNYAAPVKSFETAVEMLNNGKTAAEIHALLSKVQRFKALLPAAPKAEFAMPAPPKKMLGKRGEPEKVATTETGIVIGTTKGKVMPKPSQQKDHPFFSGFPKRQKLEEEKTVEACLSNHGSAIIAIEGVSRSNCSMSGGLHPVGDGGFKCTVCPDTQYCMACRKLDADLRIADARADSMMDCNLEDGTVSVSPSALNLALE
jgi:hypothetical protein